MIDLRTLLIALTATLGCTVGEGRGSIESDMLYLEECWDGPFSLRPDFFAANPYRDSMFIRIQRGDNIEEQSDGMIILVNDVPNLRAQRDMPINVGLPPGVTPPGMPLPSSPMPPKKVSLSLYLHNSCHAQNATIYAIEGTITFNALFNGNVNEERAENRLTRGSFGAWFADPRQLVMDPPPDREVRSWVEGDFDFFFQRGQPAQPFQ